MTHDEWDGGAFPIPDQTNPYQGPLRRGLGSPVATEEVCEPSLSFGAAAHSDLPEYRSGDEGDISTFVPDTHTLTDHDIPKVEDDDDQIRAGKTV